MAQPDFGKAKIPGTVNTAALGRGKKQDPLPPRSSFTRAAPRTR